MGPSKGLSHDQEIAQAKIAQEQATLQRQKTEERKKLFQEKQEGQAAKFRGAALSADQKKQQVKGSLLGG